ncbi:hypothetical protein C8J56DRAFT_1170423, partial [Mycena floridula]
MEQHPSVPSPIEELPNEILQLIFLEARESFSYESCALDISSFRWAAGRVSCRWRQLSLSCPEMWNYVNVAIRFTLIADRMVLREADTTAPLPSRSLEILEEHLLRARDSTISVSLQIDKRLRDRRKIEKLVGFVGSFHNAGN